MMASSLEEDIKAVVEKHLDPLKARRRELLAELRTVEADIEYAESQLKAAGKAKKKASGGNAIGISCYVAPNISRLRCLAVGLRKNDNASLMSNAAPDPQCLLEIAIDNPPFIDIFNANRADYQARGGG